MMRFNLSGRSDGAGKYRSICNDLLSTSDGFKTQGDLVSKAVDLINKTIDLYPRKILDWSLTAGLKDHLKISQEPS